MTSHSSTLPASGIFVPDGTTASTLRHRLTFEDPKFERIRAMGIKIPKGKEFIYGFQEVEGGIVVPRHFNFLTISKAHRPVLPRVEAIADGEALGEFKGKWRNQIQAEASEALLEDTDDKLLCLSCGFGKSVISAVSASKGKRAPLCIVVHTTALLRQWVKELNSLLGIPVKDIGTIGAGKCDWKGRKVVVALIPTLVNRAEELKADGFCEYWRLVIFDEAHVLGAAWFSQAIWLFRCERWGLTATPQRDDGFNDLFRGHFGSICYQYMEQPLKPVIYLAETGFGEEHLKKGIPMRFGRINVPVLWSKLGEIAPRNVKIALMIRRMLRAERKVLVVGERVNHLGELYKLVGDSADRGMFVGGIKTPDAMEKALAHDVTFATPGVVKEGVNRPDWDTLVILSPFKGKGRFDQMVGRILREHPNKHAPIVVVLIDDIGICRGLGSRVAGNADDNEWRSKQILFDRLV